MANFRRTAILVLLVVIGAGISSGAPAQPSTTPTTPPTTVTSGDPIPARPASEPPSLPDAAVFLLGTGLALLIALLAWGEQIRAITRDTRDLERDYLQSTGLTRTQLSALLQAKNDDDRLVALTNLMASGKLTSAPQVETLPLFEQWRLLGGTLRSLQSRKYWLTITLTAVFLGTGAVAAFVPIQRVSLLLALPAILVLILLVTIVSAGRIEQRLNALLMQMGEKV